MNKINAAAAASLPNYFMTLKLMWTILSLSKQHPVITYKSVCINWCCSYLPAFSSKISNGGKCSTLIRALDSCSKAAADPMTRLIWRSTKLKITNLTWNYSKNEVHITLQFNFPRAYSSTKILKTGHEKKKLSYHCSSFKMEDFA